MFEDEVLDLLAKATELITKEKKGGRGTRQANVTITKLDEARLWRQDDLQEQAKDHIIEE